MYTMRKPRKIHSIATLVKAFGGPTELANWAGLGASAISNWIDRDFIPPAWHYRLHVEALRRGFEIDPTVFGMPQPERRAGTNGNAERHRAA